LALFSIVLISVVVLVISGCRSSSGGDKQNEQISQGDAQSGEAVSTDMIHPSSTPKTSPFFVGPPEDSSVDDEKDFPQSLPHETLGELPKSTEVVEIEGTSGPLETSQPEEAQPEEGDSDVSIGSYPSPEEKPTIIPKNIFGYEYGEILEEHGLDLMQAAGAAWVRRAGIWWPDVEPSKGAYDWSQLESFEEEFLRAYQNNMKVILIVRGAPEWAQADPPYNRTCGRIREEEFSSFAKFLHELVKRYSYAPYHVKYWEIWNEPDVDPALIPEGNEWMGCWGDSQDPYYGGAYYAELLKAVYPEIKSANPEVKVLVGGLLLDCDPRNVPDHKSDCNPSNFLEGVLSSNGGDYFDGISFHAYDADHSWLGGYFNSNWHSEADITGPVLLAKLAFIKELLEEYDVVGKELINTEAALLCIYSEKSVCEMTKAYYVVHSYVSAYSMGLDANLWYFWMDRRAGLFERDLTILPSYETYSFAQDQLTDAAFRKEVPDYMPSVRVYEFQRSSGHFWVLWSMDGKRHIIELPGVPSSILDAFGRNRTPRSSIEVDLMPLYIHWDE
jgi:hypothetical protein